MLEIVKNFMHNRPQWQNKRKAFSDEDGDTDEKEDS